LPDYVSILKAQLIIKPIAGSYSQNISLPPQLGIYQTNQNNLYGQPVTSVTGGAQYGSLVTDYLYAANTEYTYDVTNYIKQQILLGPDLNQRNGVMLGAPSPASKTMFNRAVIGSRLNQNNNQTTLKIYYISYHF